MQARPRAVVAAAFLGVILSSSAARAAQVDLGLGAGYWFENSGLFDVNIGMRAGVARSLSVGGRLGAFIATNPSELGIPVDLQLRVAVGHAYLEGMAGPWILFGGDPSIRAHVGFGFGLRARSVSVGIEVGWLDPDALLSLRVAFAL
jgi:hypothetical protein